jgi:hypothetical protein
MSKLIMAFFFISTTYSYACNNSVDPKKAVIFVDTNFVYTEIMAAKKAACMRGETFVLIPDNSLVKVKEIQDAFALKHASQQSVSQCSAKYGWDSSQCVSKKQKRDEAQGKFLEIKNSFMNSSEFVAVSKESVSEKLKQLADNGVAPVSVVLSGHDGGGWVSGDAGSLSSNELLSSLKSSYKEKPELLQEMHTLLMWGCYTTTKALISQYKLYIPSLKVIAGFYGSGPLSIRPASSNLMNDVLVKSDELSSLSGASRLKTAIQGLDNYLYTYSGIYVAAQCGEYHAYNNSEYTSDGAKTERKFEEFKQEVDCYDLDETLEDNQMILAAYLSGATPIPTNTRDTELRRLYKYARQNKHLKDQCPSIDNVLALDGDRIGMLLFNHGVKANFDKVFDTEISQLKSDIDLLNTDAIDDILAGPSEVVKKAWEELENHKSTKDNNIKDHKAAYSEFTKASREALSNKSLTKQLENLDLDILLKNNSKDLSANELKKLEDFSKTLTRRKKNLLDNFISKAKEVNQVRATIDAGDKAYAKADQKHEKENSDFTSVSHYVGNIKESLKVVANTNKKQFKNMSKEDIGKYVHSLNSIEQFPDDALDREGPVFEAMKRAKKFISQIDDHLVEVKPECMNFLDWHEAVDGHMPVSHCR